MKGQIYSLIAIVVFCTGVLWSFSNGDSRGLSSVELVAAYGGCAEGCDTSNCPSGPCYWKTSGYYQKVGTGNTVAICSSDQYGGCEFYGDNVHCHTIVFGCDDSDCKVNCSNTSDYGPASCKPESGS